jgi:hypothetical protein
VNKAFLNLFNEFASLDDFRKEHDCICDYFEKIDEDGYIYNRKEGSNWLQLLLATDRTDFKVKINRSYGMQTFHVMANALDGDEKMYVVTLSNISVLDATKQKLRQALSDEIQHKVSSSRIIYQFSSIFGLDVLVRELSGQLKHSLNGINRLYHQMLENIAEPEIQNVFIQQFQLNKEMLLSEVQILKDVFMIHKDETVNPFSATEKIALLLSQSKNYPLDIEVIGNQECTYLDKSGQFLQLTLLWMMLFIRIAQQAQIKNLHLKVEIQKQVGQLSLRVSYSNSDQMATEIMKLESVLIDRSPQIYALDDTFHVCKAFVEEIYDGSFKINADDCEIVIRG